MGCGEHGRVHHLRANTGHAAQVRHLEARARHTHRCTHHTSSKLISILHVSLKTCHGSHLLPRVLRDCTALLGLLKVVFRLHLHEFECDHLNVLLHLLKVHLLSSLFKIFLWRLLFGGLFRLLQCLSGLLSFASRSKLCLFDALLELLIVRLCMIQLHLNMSFVSHPLFTSTVQAG